jgi:hypothetical protein
MAAPFIISSLRGGLNNTDPAISLADDQCVVAENVEFNLSMLGERRKGCTSVTLDASMTGDANMTRISFLFRHLPSGDETAAELWVLGQHASTQNFRLHRKTTSWSAITPATDIDVTSGRGYQLSAQSLHGKMFLGYRAVGGTVDRLHVWDGTSLRLSGLSEPVAPTAANKADVGTMVGKRYYRVRYTVQSGGATLRRSEPSDVLTFTPSGTNDGVTVTKPATISENETHWELEASINNADFYVIATTAVATTTFTDQIAFAVGYGAYTLSEDIGEYALIHSAKYLGADEDRLLFGGSHIDAEKASQFGWTPPFNNPGKGNDERLPANYTSTLNLDGFAGGPLTGISVPMFGAVWAFKWSHIYRMEQTDIATKAYVSRNVSKSMGALPGSIVEGVDQYGSPCIYFWDAKVGPCRITNRGIQSCARDIASFTQEVNLDATVICRALYYPNSRQVHFWVATGSALFPEEKKIILQTNETRETNDGVRRGWTTANGKIGSAFTACLFAQNINDNVARSLVLRPFIGVTSTNAYVLRCDTGVTDNSTAYAAQIKTKPYMGAGLLALFGVASGAILATAASGVSVLCNLISNFDPATEVSRTASLTAAATETLKNVKLDSFETGSIWAAQIEFEDTGTVTGNWQLHRFEMAPEPHEVIR